VQPLTFADLMSGLPKQVWLFFQRYVALKASSNDEITAALENDVRNLIEKFTTKVTQFQALQRGSLTKRVALEDESIQLKFPDLDLLHPQQSVDQINVAQQLYEMEATASDHVSNDFRQSTYSIRGTTTEYDDSMDFTDIDNEFTYTDREIEGAEALSSSSLLHGFEEVAGFGISVDDGFFNVNGDDGFGDTSFTPTDDGFGSPAPLATNACTLTNSRGGDDFEDYILFLQAFFSFSKFKFDLFYLL
jgi:hypothetical protein